MSKPTRKRIVLLAGVLLVTGLVVIVAWFWKNSLRLDDFIIEGNTEVPASEIIRLTRLKKGSRLSAIQPVVIQRRISRHPWIRTVTVVREFPSALRISVTEREPVLRVTGVWEGFVDETGRGMPLASQTIYDLPTLGDIRKADFDTVYGKARHPGIKKLAAVLGQARRNLPALFYQVSDFRLTSRDTEIMMYTAPGSIPVYLSAHGLDEQLIAFRAFWKQVVTVYGPESFEYIDFRQAGVITTRERG